MVIISYILYMFVIYYIDNIFQFDSHKIVPTALAIFWVFRGEIRINPLISLAVKDHIGT